jgi:hypothetical protein
MPPKSIYPSRRGTPRRYGGLRINRMNLNMYLHGIDAEPRIAGAIKRGSDKSALAARPVGRDIARA